MVYPRKLHGWLPWFAVLLMASVAVAEPPKAVIDGPASRKQGDTFILDASKSSGEHQAWKVKIKLAGNPAEKWASLERRAEELRAAGWAVVPPAADAEELFVSLEGDKKIVLPTYPGEYTAILAVSNAEGVDLAEYSLTIDGGIVPNPPGPTPPPDPTPQPVGLSALVAAEVAKVVTADSKDAWLAVAAAYDAVAMMEQLEGTTTELMLVATGLAEKGPGVPAQWATIKAAVVTPQLQALADKGGLTTVADYAKTWREIAAGVKTGAGAQPPPIPVVVDPVVPAPIPGAGLRVLIIEETADRGTLPASQQRIFTSTKVLGWLKTNAPGKWRIWDKDIDPKLAPAEFQGALAKPRNGLPWLVISNGTTGYNDKLPLTEDDTLTLLEKYK